MSTTDNLVDALKQHMRAKKITYRDAADALGVSEVTVKRLFSEKNFTIARLEQLCDLTQTSLADLMATAEEQLERLDQLTIEQEREIVSDPKLLLVGVCIFNRYTFEDILGKYAISEPELVGLFAKLDKMGVIELLPGNKYRLRLSPDFGWQPRGPIQTFFIESLVKEYMVGEMEQSDHSLHFVWGTLSEENARELEHRIRRLVDDYVHLTQPGRSRQAKRHNSSLLVLFKENWEPSFFKRLWQEKHGLK